MLPSMPILFTRDSQDAFGNKTETNPSTIRETETTIKAEAVHKTVEKCSIVTEKPTTVNGNAGVSSQVKVNPNKLAESVLDAALVRSYYTKIQSRFSANQNVPTNKFVQFNGILKSFNPAVESPIDLYKKIEQHFGDEHKDLVEEFLLFLNPGQAAQIGRFMNHFALVQMTSFIQMLHNTFSRKPTVLKKVLRSMSAGINSGSSSGMKARVLPHLHSNPRLMRKFLSMFPDERPPDSVYEHGTDKLNENFLTNDKGYDVWEFEEKNGNKRKLDKTKGLDSLYLNGRVFLQHGKMLRPARVTYPYSKEPYRSTDNRLGPNRPRFLSPEPDDERSSPKKIIKCVSKPPSKRSKKQIKLPLKHAKDVNDNTKHKALTATSTCSPKTKNKTQSNLNAKTCKKAKDKQDVKTNQGANCACEDLRRINSKAKHKSENASEVQSDHKKNIIKSKSNKTETVTKIECPVLVRNGEGNHSNGVNDTESVKLESNNTHEDLIKDETDEANAEVRSWTRDEDKILLQIIKGEPGSEGMLEIIEELLPDRSVTEIQGRFCEVMEFLRQMEADR